MVFVDTDRRFPTVTICNMCPFSFRGKDASDPLFQILANASGFHSLFPAINTSTWTAVNIVEVYILNGVLGGPMTIFTEEGPCYQFNSVQHAPGRGHWNVTSHGRHSGLRLLLNIHQDDYGIVFDNNAGLRYSFLPAPYRSYGSDSCLETDKHSDTLRAKMPTGESYDFQRCRDLCVVRRASLLCGCYIVGMGQSGNGILPVECDCPRPCSFVRYDIVVSSSQMPSEASLPAIMKYLNITEASRVRQNFLELRVFFESDLVRRESHVAQYTTQSYLSECSHLQLVELELPQLPGRPDGDLPGGEPDQPAGVAGDAALLGAGARKTRSRQAQGHSAATLGRATDLGTYARCLTLRLT
ncbi:hypothetical protein EGW08_017549 [Elysia chlorotica]|uniref:Uncharacterized protein n=1 Tax=Elysia chlorotica TaxID=188477 RepID=A0A3S1AXD1_ELYCH|nr:hypothetical protein EGW08_017549 [Elysia chlorotica]